MSNQQTTDKKVIKNEVFGVYFDTGSTKQLVAVTDLFNYKRTMEV